MSPPVTASSPSSNSKKSAQNVAGRMLDDSDVEPSDLTILASPTASDKDVDMTVEQTCDKVNLTVTNVRSIIRVSIYVVIFTWTAVSFG